MHNYVWIFYINYVEKIQLYPHIFLHYKMCCDFNNNNKDHNNKGKVADNI